MKMMVVGQRAMIGTDALELAIPVMRQIRDEFYDTVALGVIQGPNVVVIESVPGTHPFIFTLNPGFTGQIHVTAPGKAIMAWYDNARRAAILDQMTFKKYNERTITSHAAFVKELDRTRKRGWAFDNAEEYDGVYCIAVPFFDRTGYPLAAIWMTGPSNRVPVARHPAIAERMKTLAGKISAALGYVPEGLVSGA
ncbi:MAG: IclR family transcriptional regulator [Kiritimatiellae bacterium]|nr:IclR family transcriptional regulator [Kiritimatiellia bacterium]